MKKLFIYLFILFLMITITNGENIISTPNNNYSITLTLENICGIEQENIFKIQRINYTTGSYAELITYNTTCDNKTTLIEKKIKKYVGSKTGSCTFLKSKNYTITFQDNNQSFNWNMEIYCEKENNTQEELKEENIIEEEPIECFDKLGLTINKELFEKGEQIIMDFSTNKKPDFFELTYWIETINGTYLKNKRTTTNLDTKRFTFNTIIQLEEGAYVRGIAHDNCSEKNIEKLILLQGTKSTKTDKTPKTIQETNLEIKQIEQLDNQHLKITIHAQRGKSRSSVIYLETKKKNKQSISKVKIILKKQNSDTTIESIMPIKNEKEGLIFLKGLGIEIEKEFIIKKEPTISLIRTYTKQTTYTNNITWYVRTKQTKPIFISIKSDNKTTEFIVNKTAETTTAKIIPYSGGIIKTTISNGVENIYQENRPLIKQKISALINKTSMIVSSTKLIKSDKNITLKPTIELRKIELIIKNKTIQKAFYGLFGSIIAGSTYLLLKEQ